MSLETDESVPRSLDSTSLPIPRGYGYLVGWAGLIAFSLLAALFAISSGSLVVVVPFLAFAGLGLVVVLLTRETRCLEADAVGVRVKRGPRIAKEIHWQEIREVRYGTRVVPMAGERVREGVFLTVRGHSFLKRIDFDTEGFGVTDAELARFAAQVAALARDRGVPVERRFLHPRST